MYSYMYDVPYLCRICIWSLKYLNREDGMDGRYKLTTRRNVPRNSASPIRNIKLCVRNFRFSVYLHAMLKIKYRQWLHSWRIQVPKILTIVCLGLLFMGSTATQPIFGSTLGVNTEWRSGGLGGSTAMRSNLSIVADWSQGKWHSDLIPDFLYWRSVCACRRRDLKSLDFLTQGTSRKFSDIHTLLYVILC